MTSSAKKIQVSSFDDLFQPDGASAMGCSESVHLLPIRELHAFANHPFLVRDDEEMEELIKSVQENGILSPLLVRPRAAGGYELVSGHRRCHAAERAGLQEVPALIRQLDDDESTVLMVDANLQREQLLPSEKAWAYRLKLEAMKRQSGRSQDPHTGNPSGMETSSAELAAQTRESKSTIFRWIRLTHLIPGLLKMVDDEQLGLTPANELSYLQTGQQNALFAFLKKNKIHRISLEQAKLLRCQQSSLTDGDLQEIFEPAQRERSISLKIPASFLSGVPQKVQPDEELLRQLAAIIEAYYRG